MDPGRHETQSNSISLISQKVGNCVLFFPMVLNSFLSKQLEKLKNAIVTRVVKLNSRVKTDFKSVLGQRVSRDSSSMTSNMRDNSLETLEKGSQH